MKTYIAFLRGINVSGQKKIKMADLRASLRKQGLENVRTYIQSGNIIFETLNAKTRELEITMEKAIKLDFGFEVPVLIRTPQEIQDILNENPFGGETDIKGLYFALLHKTPLDELATTFQQLKFENDDFHYTSDCVYLNCKMGAGKAKLTNNLIESKLKVTTTTRNLNTMKKMIALAQDQR
ncbi:MAG: DUF1697 domain-containing protein [Bacteroidota bacterium]